MNEERQTADMERATELMAELFHIMTVNGKLKAFYSPPWEPRGVFVEIKKLPTQDKGGDHDSR